MKNDSRSLVRVANRQLVLQQLFNHPATTRVDIARELKINKSTVSAIYNELNDEGFIEELGQGGVDQSWWTQAESGLFEQAIWLCSQL